MLTHARIFSCWGKTGMRSLFFTFSFLSFLETVHNHLPPGIISILYIHYPITFLHFFCLLSRLSLHSYSFSFFFYFRQRLVSQLQWSSTLSLPPTFCPLSLCLCHHLCVRNQMKLLPSAATHMQAVSCPHWGIYITSPPSLPSFLHRSFVCSPPTASIVSCAPRVFTELNASLRYSNQSRITGCSIHRFTLVCNNLWAGSGLTIVMFHASCRFMIVVSEASSSTNSLLTLSNLNSDDKKIKIHLNIFQWLIAFGTLVQLIYFIRGLKLNSVSLPTLLMPCLECNAYFSRVKCYHFYLNFILLQNICSTARCCAYTRTVGVLLA